MPDTPLRRTTAQRPVLDAETLAYWYFRLNGFLMLPNFIVHPDRSGGTRTEIDILGVRFPYRLEQPKDPMKDDREFSRIEDKPYIVFAEVKTRYCGLNTPWRDPNRGNAKRFLHLIGAYPRDGATKISNTICQQGWYSDERYHISYVMVGGQINKALRKELPEVPQITWDDIAAFVFFRFDRYYRQKRNHDQWDEAGKELWKIFEENRKDRKTFCNALTRQVMP